MPCANGENESFNDVFIRVSIGINIYANEYLTCIRSFLLYGIDATKYIHYFFTRILKLRFNVLKSSSQKMFQKLRTPKLSHFQSVLLRKKCVPRLQDEHI